MVIKNNKAVGYVVTTPAAEEKITIDNLDFNYHFEISFSIKFILLLRLVANSFVGGTSMG